MSLWDSMKNLVMKTLLNNFYPRNLIIKNWNLCSDKECEELYNDSNNSIKKEPDKGILKYFKEVDKIVNNACNVSGI